MILSILKKELRSRALALLAMPLLAVAGFWAVSSLADAQDAREYESILASSFAIPVTLICAGIGLALGLWQTLPETRVDAWAFLIHRPVSRTQLFFGKLLAALLIYLAVLVVPLAWVIWYAATPGHFLGPWLWPMAVPSLVDLLCGTVYIVAGMLIALREARWFGSRLLPLGLAILCSALTWAPYLWLAFSVIAAGWLILLPAALSAMNSRGRENAQGRLGRTLTAVSLLPAMIGIPAFIGTITTELLRPRSNPTQTQHYYALRGTQLYEDTYGPGKSQRRLVVDDKGALLHDAPTQIEVEGTSAGLVIDWKEAGYADDDYLHHYRFASSHLIDVRYRRRSVTGDRWCYLIEQGCFVGYQRLPHGQSQCLGYLGANGYTQNLSGIAPFETMHNRYAWGDDLLLMVENHSILSLDFEHRRCSSLLTLPPVELAASAAHLQVQPLTKGAPLRSLLAVATDRAVYLLDENQKVLLRQPNLGKRYPVVNIGVSDDLQAFAILYEHKAWQSESSRVFMRISADGSLLTRTMVPGIPGPAFESNPVEPYIAIALPPAVVIAGLIFDPPQPAILPSLPFIGASIALSSLLSLALAYWLLKRFNARPVWTLFWILIILPLGLSGILLLLAIRLWPPRIPCATCHRRTIASAPVCQHCHTPFPLPDPGPIAIRDQATPSPVASL